MAEIVGDPENMAGGTDGALQTDFPTSVGNVLSEDPSASMVLEESSSRASSRARSRTRTVQLVPVSSIDSPGSIITDGNFIVMMRQPRGAGSSPTSLAGGGADLGGARRLHHVQPGRRPESDPVYQETATAISEGEVEVVKFDLGPAAGGVRSHGRTGLWKLFQDFIANPDDIDGIAQQMEDAAAAAYGG